MPVLKRKTIIIIAISVCLVNITGILIWLFFPAILRSISPTLYTGYAFNETKKVISTELSEINNFFDFPDFLDSDIKQLTIDLNNINADISYGGVKSPDIDLTKLDIGIDILYDRVAKQASLGLNTGWDGNSFMLTLFTNVEQIALELNDDSAWVVNAGSFGNELDEIGLNVDKDMELDLGFLFPDIISDEAKENTLQIAAEFFKALKFRRDRDSDYFDKSNGTTMTTIISGIELQDFFNDLIESYYGQSEMGNELRHFIQQTEYTDYKLDIFINNNHIIQAILLSVITDTDTDMIFSLQLPEELNLLDHIILDINIRNDHGSHMYTLESKGRHVPVDGIFSNITTITGFDAGIIVVSSEIQKNGSFSFTTQVGLFSLDAGGSLCTDSETIMFSLHKLYVEAYQYGSLSLLGDMVLSYGKTSSVLRDISADAQAVADMEIGKFLPVFLIVWEILQQDQILMDMFSEPIFDFAVTFVFGDQLGSYINDYLDIHGAGILDTLFDLFSGHLSDAFSNILENIMLDNLIDMLDGFGDYLSETIENRLNDLLSGLFDFFQGDE